MRIKAHSARLVGLSDGVRAGRQNVLLYLVPRGAVEPCAVALSLDDAHELLAGLTVLLPEADRSEDDLTRVN